MGKRPAAALDPAPARDRPSAPARGDTEAALLEEARARARRRRRRVAAAVLALLALASGLAILLDSGGGGRPAGSQERRAQAVRPGRVLAREPYMGVSCRRANSIACDRVGLAVWTRRPARAVRATVAGRTFALDDAEWSGPSRHGLRRMFAGFLHHAGLRGSGPLAVQVENGRNRWTGVRPVSASVHLVISYRDCSQRATIVRVSLAPGWG